MNSNQLEEWGSHCSLSTCHALDFLPFKCQHCSKLYCSDHFKPSIRPSEHSHQCSELDESLIDARVPTCPLCGDPISIPSGTDPNLPMDQHLTSSCRLIDQSGLLKSNSKSTSSSSPSSSSSNKICSRARCQTKMIVPILCTDCQSTFCPSHRLRADHACSGAPQPFHKSHHRASLMALKSVMASIPSSSKPVTSKPMTLNQTSSSVTSSIPSNKPTPSLSTVDRYRVSKRVKAEEESRRKALEWRAQKGLLSEDEKIIYANLKASSIKSESSIRIKSNGKECLMS
ncbi:hypothetical protein DFH28DRAFT_927119 [Melampsora americana]|nr:hypothetical protein DFH28DRAFT_927119 [Melampsora americana]